MQLGTGYDYWLMKFDNVSKNGDHGLEDKPEYTLIEYAYYLMACACGITMNECRIYDSEGDWHFMTRRFDRENGKKLHMQSLGALAHISYQEPGVKMGIKGKRCKDIVSEIAIKVCDFKSFAEQVGIKEKTYNYINSVIEANMKNAESAE